MEGYEMKKLKKRNQPAKGSRITVEPIRKIEDIKSISRLLEGSPRDRLLFVMGVNNGIRMGDLLKLKVKDVGHLKEGDYITIKEGKTKKDNVLVVNKPVFKALKNYLDKVQPRDDDYLFASRKGNRPLQTKSINRLIKSWTKAINLKGNYGAHTLRKTWGYIQRTKHGVGFEIICKRFNHSNPAVTMRYLGIQDKEVHDILMNEIG
jgi:integrase